MIIKKYAEATMDESVFYGKVEVETNTRTERENVIRILRGMNDGDCVCHCNLKENAELVARILDCDAENKVYTQAIERMDEE